MSRQKGFSLWRAFLLGGSYPQGSLRFLSSESSHILRKPEVLGDSVALCRNPGLPGRLCAGGAEQVRAGARLHHATGLGSEGQLPHRGQCGHKCWWPEIPAIWLSSRDCLGPGSGEPDSKGVQSLPRGCPSFSLRLLSWQWCRM